MKQWLILAGVLLLLIVGISFIKTPLVAASTAGRTVRVGIYDNKPKVYTDESGKPAGLYVDILNYIAQKENWNLEYVPGNWEDGLDRLETGDIDVMVDVAVSEERQEKYDFTTETVFSSWGVIYVNKDSDIDSFFDLRDKRIAILKSSIYLGESEGIDHYIKAFDLNAVLVEVDNYSDVFDLIDLGVVDAGVVGRVFGTTNQKDYPNLKATDLFFKPTELRFALTQGDIDNPYLIERLDYWMKKLKAGEDGYYRKTLEKYGLLELDPNSGEPVIAKTEVKRGLDTSNWVLPFAIGVNVGLLLAGFYTVLMRLLRKRALLSLKGSGE